MANIDYTLKQANDGIKGGLAYLRDFDFSNITEFSDIKGFKTYMDTLTSNSLKANIGNTIKTISDFNDEITPGSFYVYNNELTLNSPFPGSKYYLLLIVRQIGDLYLHLTVYYYKGNMKQYDRRAIKKNNKWSWNIEGTGSDKDNPVPWVRTYNSSEIIPLEDGGTGRNLSSIGDNYIMRHSNSEDTPKGLYGIKPESGALYATGDNALPKFDTLPIALGGTGRTTSPSAIVKLTSENTVNILSSTDNLELGVNGILPAKHGGTGRNLIEVGNNYIMRKTNPNDDDIHPGLKGIQPVVGALYYTGENYESGDTSIKQPPKFGILPLECGGTGKDISDMSPYSIIRMSSDPKKYPYFVGVPIGEQGGAFYAKSNTSGPEFGTLPVTLGGTGAISNRTVYTLINGDDIIKDENNKPFVALGQGITLTPGGNSLVAIRYIPYIKAGWLRGYISFKSANSIEANTSFRLIDFSNILDDASNPLRAIIGTPLTVYRISTLNTPLAYFSISSASTTSPGPGIYLVLPNGLNANTAYGFYFSGWLFGSTS